MRMNQPEILFVGTKGYVVAFSKRDGTQLWKTWLGGGMAIAGDKFVTLLADGERVYAHTYGKLFCLDAQTGQPLWTNDLPGLGYDLATLAVDGASSPSVPLVDRRRESEARQAAAGSDVT